MHLTVVRWMLRQMFNFSFIPSCRYLQIQEDKHEEDRVRHHRHAGSNLLPEHEDKRLPSLGQRHIHSYYGQPISILKCTNVL